MNESSKVIRFLYGNCVGRFLLKIIMGLRLDKPVTRYLWSSASKPMIHWYAKSNRIPLTPEQRKTYGSFRDFFVRTRESNGIDTEKGHLISPCDGWLSAFTIDSESRFSIKNSFYRVEDFLQDESLAKNYQNGTILVFRLCASDYHHYCYIDNGYQGQHHYVPGVLHSVQPIACEKFPVYVLNKRCWSLLTTESFGPVVQCEIGALVIGGIFNAKENSRICKGHEKGHFELAGSTIVLLFEPDKIRLIPRVEEYLARNAEMRVTLGEWIGIQKEE